MPHQSEIMLIDPNFPDEITVHKGILNSDKSFTLIDIAIGPGGHLLGPDTLACFDSPDQKDDEEPWAPLYATGILALSPDMIFRAEWTDEIKSAGVETRSARKEQSLQLALSVGVSARSEDLNGYYFSAGSYRVVAELEKDPDVARITQVRGPNADFTWDEFWGIEPTKDELEEQFLAEAFSSIKES